MSADPDQVRKSFILVILPILFKTHLRNLRNLRKKNQCHPPICPSFNNAEMALN